MTRPKLSAVPTKAKQISMERIKQAVRLYRSIYAPRHIRRANARSWLRSVEMLGPKWKLAESQKLERIA